VNLLLDTHALLWWLGDPGSLSLKARQAIADPENTVFLSAVVVWEIRIKAALGKLDLPKEFREVLDDQPFIPLPLTVAHAHALEALPAIHRDPFDRMLVAQALSERLTIVTRDSSIPDYSVPTIEA
jgi:PIN domain nuclease of toxin-antitoxin system